MPILNVKVAAHGTPELTRELSELLLELTARILGKQREVTAIAIDYVDPGDWSVGGVPLGRQRRSSICLDIRITDETNTKDEKARYIAEAFAGFRRILGDLHEVSYVHVHDVRAAAYGYGGLTQEHRYQR